MASTAIVAKNGMARPTHRPSQTPGSRPRTVQGEVNQPARKERRGVPLKCHYGILLKGHFDLEILLS
eukprot:3854574-Amphidinium_carterae.1